MEFAITFKGDLPLERTVALCKQAEVAGFDYAWFFDSHVLWRECYTTMAVCMRETRRLRFGPCVTNPLVRDWTVAASLFANLSDLSQGRFDVGVGRGDSSRRLLGFQPSSLEEMQRFCDFVVTLVEGREVSYRERPQRLSWTEGRRMATWMAAYGPKALAVAGEHADGLVLQIADPWLVGWFASQAKEAARLKGRSPSALRIMAAAPSWIGPLAKCREQVRWFPALVGNHVADLVERYGADSQVPARLTDYIKGRRGYDYRHHAEKDADHLDFISDEVVDSFSVLGSLEDHLAKLKELEAAGVTQFNIYLMCGEEERIVAEYGQHIIPYFKQVAR